MAELAADTSRMALIQSVVDASQSVDRAVSMNMAMSLAMEWAMVSAMPDQPSKPTFRQLQDHVAATVCGAQPNVAMGVGTRGTCL